MRTKGLTILSLGILFGLLHTLNAAPSDNTKRVQKQQTTQKASQRSQANTGANKANARNGAKSTQANKQSKNSQAQSGNSAKSTQGQNMQAPKPSQNVVTTQTPPLSPSKPLPNHLPSGPTPHDRSTWGVKSGFFGGIGVGAGMMLFSTPNMNNNSRNDSYNYNGDLCGGGNQCRSTDSVLTVDYTARLGFQYYFTMHQGIRMYASYTGGSGFPVGYSGVDLYYMNNSADFNVDYLVEIAQVKKMAFGVFVGASVGYANFLSTQTGSASSNNSLTPGTKSTEGLMVNVNFGVGYTFLRHHRFDITAKVPMLYLSGAEGIYKGNMWVNNTGSNSGNSTKTINYRYASMNVSYSFIF